MLFTHSLEGLLLCFILEVKIRLLNLLFLLQVILGIQVHDDLYGLHIFLRVYGIDFPEEFPLVQAFFSVVDHIHGKLRLQGKELLVLSLAQGIKHFIYQIKESMVMEQTSKEDSESWLEVIVLAVGLSNVDQGVSNSQFQGIVGVVSQEDQVNQVEDGLAEGKEEEDRDSDVIEILG